MSGDGPADLVDALRTEEKLRLVRGTVPDGGEDVPTGTTGHLPAVDRLGIELVRMVDGPVGVRGSEATAFPAATAVAAAFDTGLAERFGAAMGRETRERDIDVLLAPGCNLVRVPQCGRIFEYFGEDPHHNARTTAAVVRGIQSAGVAATPKHYVANNQEYERATVSSELGERPLRELYLPAFEAAVDAGAGAVMSAYNRINGTRASEHGQLQDAVLKDEFGFDGPVLSDWWAVADGVAAATGGLDIEMPGVDLLPLMAMVENGAEPLRWLDARWPDALPGVDDLVRRGFQRHADPGGMPTPTTSLFEAALPAALADGRLDEARLDEMVRRALTLHERVGALDGGTRRVVDVDLDAHRELAREVAVRGSVLLANDDTLPLDPSASVALLGPNVAEARLGGGGSSEVTPHATVSPAEALRDRSEGRVRVEHGHPPVDSPSLFDPREDLRARLLPGRNSSVADAAAAARGADVAVVVVGDAATESADRSLTLPGEQDRLVATVADAAARTVVVLQTGGPVELPWLDAVDAVLATWYPGQETGDALAAVLYGDRDPGGRLPITFGAGAGDYPANSTARYPGTPGAAGYVEARYDEGVFVGYRHFDARGIEPMFPFGHGLSYADFAYTDLSVAVDAVNAASAVPGGDAAGTATVTVENVGDRAGREVVQAYVRPPETGVERPPRELAGYAAVDLDAGESRTVEVGLDARAFGHHDDGWTVPGGPFTLAVGRSSRDARLTERVDVGE